MLPTLGAKQTAPPVQGVGSSDQPLEISDSSPPAAAAGKRKATTSSKTRSTKRVKRAVLKPPTPHPAAPKARKTKLAFATKAGAPRVGEYAVEACLPPAGTRQSRSDSQCACEGSREALYLTSAPHSWAWHDAAWLNPVDGASQSSEQASKSQAPPKVTVNNDLLDATFHASYVFTVQVDPVGMNPPVFHKLVSSDAFVASLAELLPPQQVTFDMDIIEALIADEDPEISKPASTFILAYRALREPRHLLASWERTHWLQLNKKSPFGPSSEHHSWSQKYVHERKKRADNLRNAWVAYYDACQKCLQRGLLSEEILVEPSLPLYTGRWLYWAPVFQTIEELRACIDAVNKLQPIRIWFFGSARDLAQHPYNRVWCEDASDATPSVDYEGAAGLLAKTLSGQAPPIAHADNQDGQDDPDDPDVADDEASQLGDGAQANEI